MTEPLRSWRCHCGTTATMAVPLRFMPYKHRSGTAPPVWRGKKKIYWPGRPVENQLLWPELARPPKKCVRASGNIANVKPCISTACMNASTSCYLQQTSYRSRSSGVGRKRCIRRRLLSTRRLFPSTAVQQQWGSDPRILPSLPHSTTGGSGTSRTWWWRRRRVWRHRSTRSICYSCTDSRAGFQSWETRSCGWSMGCTSIHADGRRCTCPCGQGWNKLSVEFVRMKRSSSAILIVKGKSWSKRHVRFGKFPI